MGTNLHHHDEVAAGTAVGAGVALAPEGEGVAGVGAGGNLDGNLLGPTDGAATPAGLAGLVDDLALAGAALAGLGGAHHAQHGALLDPDVAGAPAVGADFRSGAGLAAGAVAVGAGLHPVDIEFLFAAEGGLLETEDQPGAQVFSGNGGVGVALTAGAAAETTAEEGGEDVAQVEVLKPAAAEAAGPEVGVYAGVAVLVVPGALIRVGEHLVGLVDLLKLGLRLGVTGVEVRVIFLGQLTVGLFDLFVRGRAVHAQYLVVIAFIFSHVTHLLVRKILYPDETAR